MDAINRQKTALLFKPISAKMVYSDPLEHLNDININSQKKDA
jgi:hypothetical protein